MKIVRKVSITILISFLALTLVTSASAAVGDTTLISVNSDGIQGFSDSVLPAISADGKYVAFYSYAWNLMDYDSNLAADVFVRNLATRKTILVSANSNGIQGNGESLYPSISADGRYIAFQSDSTNLVAGDTNDSTDIFVRDIVAGTTTRVSVNSNGEQANNKWSESPWISADGRYVAFSSGADNLVDGDTNGRFDVFVRDLQDGVTARVSVDSNGVEANGSSLIPSISSDGRYVAFYSGADNLVSSDKNLVSDIFVHDNATGTTTRISVSSGGVEGNDYAGDASLAISGDGRYVAFYSYANNLVTGDTNDVRDVFVHDLTTKKTIRVSVDSNGNQGNNASYYPSISADGRYVAFDSFANNLVDNDNNTNGDGLSEVFVHDLETGITKRVSVATGGAESNGGSGVGHSSLSADGRFVVFQSSADNLVSLDVNSIGYDIFIHETDAVSSQTFVDVPTTHPLYKYIQALYDAGYTAGCSSSPMMFCPDTILDRAQSAVFMLRGQMGSGYTPPAVTGIFGDNWTGFEWAQPWAEGMYQEGLTTGCQSSPLLFCPANQLPRVEASIFGLRMKYGVGYAPPAASGTLFADFPPSDPSYWGIDWAEQAYLDGLLPACGTDSGTGKPMFCPSQLVDRGWGAYLIVKAKNLPTP